jgi:hypothetical protein
MSGSIAPTVAAPPNAIQAATDLLALMAGLSGVATDYNAGSQIRTLAESVGAVLDMTGVGTTALVLQGMAYGAMGLFGIQPAVATAASGFVTFATSFPVSAALATTQAVAIPVSTLVQTAGGVVFATTASGVLTGGATSVTLPVQATTAGVAGNVAASGISGQPLTGLGYPLFVSNASAMTGGAAAQQLSQTLAQFTAKAGSLGLSSPYAIANAMIGTVASGSAETVQFATCYEPWIAAGSGAGSGTAGFTVFVDNGTGAATSGLLAAVTTKLTGSYASGMSGYRPAGVPFGVSAVVPVYATVTVSGTLVPGFVNASIAASAATTSINGYFNGLAFNTAAQQPQVAASVVNAALGYFSSVSVVLAYSSASGTPVTVVSGTGVPWRVILNSLSVTVGN